LGRLGRSHRTFFKILLWGSSEDLAARDIFDARDIDDGLYYRDFDLDDELYIRDFDSYYTRNLDSDRTVSLARRALREIRDLALDHVLVSSPTPHVLPLMPHCFFFFR
jgi:hypothetical protein